jgi:hypothetical protein
MHPPGFFVTALVPRVLPSNPLSRVDCDEMSNGPKLARQRELPSFFDEALVIMPNGSPQYLECANV